MLRGSAALLQLSARHYAPLVHTIVSADEIWTIDADDYGKAHQKVVFETAKQIRTALSGNASHILITKIMLGVFGCVPAFDSYFKKGLGVATFGEKSLQRVAQFYEKHFEVIERNRVYTLDFTTGLPTSRRYTRAKVIDMIFFVEGASKAGDAEEAT